MRHIKPLLQSDSRSDEYLYTLGDIASNTAPKVNVKINDIIISMIIDTGASMEVMDHFFFANVNYKTISVYKHHQSIYLQVARTQFSNDSVCQKHKSSCEVSSINDSCNTRKS